MHFTRDQLVKSAQQTVDAFGLEKGDTLLNCLSTNHAAGFMMVIRALAFKMNLLLVNPKSDPFQDLETDTKLDFAAFVPYQLTSILTGGPANKHILDNMKAVILGGGPVSPSLETQCHELKCPVYHTYGMTETLTHVALRDVKANSSMFRALKQVLFKQDDQGCLMIQSPVTDDEWLITNDLVKLIDQQTFEWVGRVDNVVNSGGYKIQTDELEQKISSSVHTFFGEHPYFLFPQQDEKLGEKLCLLIEGPSNEELADQFKVYLKSQIKPVEIPKEIYFIQNFEYSDLGKINRQSTINLLGKHGRKQGEK
ncbi:AMP-binding protein [Bacteroidota bacterium]